MKYRTYIVTNKLNGKQYVGFTSRTISQRWVEHILHSRRLKSQLLHKAIKKHGENNFIVEEIETFDNKKDVLAHEVYLIKNFKLNVSKYPDGNGYNLTDGGENPPNHKGKRLKNSEKLRNRKLSDKHKENVSRGLVGHIVSDITKQKIKKSNTGKKHNNETKKKMQEIASKLRKNKTYEEIHGIGKATVISNKISQALTGKPKSAEHSKKVSDALTGRTLSAEHIAAIRLAKENSDYIVSDDTRKLLKERSTGRKKSVEWSNKTSQAMKGRNFKKEKYRITTDDNIFIFNSLKDCANHLNISVSMVRKILTGKTHKSYTIERFICD